MIDTPIAIVGMACRFPHADGLGAFWRLLEAGENGVIEGEPGSGIGRIGTMFSKGEGGLRACRFGGYIDDLDQFDAAFFHISPIEARFLDPQQRMMLETCWRALEDAGINPDFLKGSHTGVYAGISINEYRGLILERTRPDEPAASLYSVSGTALNTAIGRVAYTLGLEGPAFAVDTACSSSLVAINQAIAGLQRGETDLALAGGVHAMFSGRLHEIRAISGMISPDGRCAAFDAAANGYVRGEGCGIVVLKRLEDAEACGDRIWAVVRGCAVNQDGASSGMTVPNGAAQEKVIAAALQRAGFQPSDVDYLEAHGTGTAVGDPIEAQAAGKAYGRGRDPDRPLLMGSVKTNIGHLEAAAGVAGVIKTVLAMNRGVIPRHLHYQDPSPKIDWEQLPIRVTATQTNWPHVPRTPPRAGVSSYGWSGTNAHIVLEGYGDRQHDPDRGPDFGPTGPPHATTLSQSAAGDQVLEAEHHPRRTRLLPLSGRSRDVLRELAERYLSWLDERADILAAGDSDTDLLADMAWTAAAGRSHFDNRTAVVFQDAASLRAGLRRFCEADEAETAPAVTKVAFAFTGQASQWPGMGEALYASEPVFRAVLDRCDAVLADDRGSSLLDVMFARPGASGDLNDPQWVLPAIYALECALTELWTSLGVRPDVVVGHSLGEIAAAHAAGVFSLEDGLRFAAARGELIGGLSGEGAMAAVFAPASRVAEAVDAHNAKCTADIGLCVAVDNGTHQVVSGPAEQIGAFVEAQEAQGLRVARLRKSPAYHSAMVEPALDALEVALSGTVFSPPSITFVSNRTGCALDAGEVPDATYWRRQAREPVAFQACVETLAEMGVDGIIEMGPHAVLGPLIAMTWPEDEGFAPPVTLSSLRRPARDEELPQAGSGGGFVEAVAGAYEAGLSLRFDGLVAGERRRRIALPGYPFERKRYWVDGNRRRSEIGHPLLGTRHESANGGIAFDTEVFPTDPKWLQDHRVFGRVIAPGALFGAMAASATLAEGAETAVVEDFAIHSALVMPDEGGEVDAAEEGRHIQVLLENVEGEPSRRIRVLSRGEGEDQWTLHAEGRVSTAAGSLPHVGAAFDVEQLKAGLSRVDLSAFYRTRTALGIEFGPSFHTLEAVWARAGEAVAEVALPAGVDRDRLDVHPLVLDGCFQAFGAARSAGSSEDDATYLPFAWERLWFAGRLPERLICHVRVKETPHDAGENAGEGGKLPEVHAADMRFLDPSGAVVGELSGFAVKRASRTALLSAVEGIDGLLYEVVWKDCALAPGNAPADFLPPPSEIAASTSLFPEHLRNEGVDAPDRAALLADLDRLSSAYALATLDKLGWRRVVGEAVAPEELRETLGVGAEHGRLFRRMLGMLARTGVLSESGEDFEVNVASGESLPEGLSNDPDAAASEMMARYDHGAIEIGLLRRCGGALAEVLRGRTDPLSLLFSGGEPSAADLYKKAPVARAAVRMLAEAVAVQVGSIPEGRRLRVLEVGAGTGSSTAAVLPELPEGSCDYTYTDISAGFFAEAESRFEDAGVSIEYRVLDIEKDPVEQGFDRHGYDLVIASDVLHATRDLNETLVHCLELLAPSGQLVALEILRSPDWLDLTFGQLDGWWRFADEYRPHHALAPPDVWHRALSDAGFEVSAIVGVDEADPAANPDRGIVLAQGPALTTETPGVWVLAADSNSMADELAAQLAERNQSVVIASEKDAPSAPAIREVAGVTRVCVDLAQRGSWRALLEDLSGNGSLAGVVHLVSLDGRGAKATTVELAQDIQGAAASALALTQALVDCGLTLPKGLWFVTQGGQILERERGGQLSGATLWGLGKVAAREAPQLQPRMLDLDPADTELPSDLADEFLHPDAETHVARRSGRRQCARLVHAADVNDRLSLPVDSRWKLVPDADGSLDSISAVPMPERRLGSGEVRSTVEALGLDFGDVLVARGANDDCMGREFCGRVLEVGDDVTDFAAGDRVVGLAFDGSGSETVAPAELIVPAPSGFSVSELATIPTAFVSAALSFELSGLDAGDRVLIHAGADGVGLAAIQIAQATGAEVFATASVREREYLRSLGVDHVFDSRSTAFGQEILEVTNGAGVDMVLNSLTGEEFIEASLSCLAKNGRFVEMGRADILSEDEMASIRPDASYVMLSAGVLKEQVPARVGGMLKRVMARLEAGELTPLRHARWSVSETVRAIKSKQGGRHSGEIVITNSPLASGRLREDRTYLVTGGLGGIGCVVAGWLAQRGAGTIALNGRRPPNGEALRTIESLRESGHAVHVELADMTEADEVDAMLARIKNDLPPLGGVIHSVGVLSDASIGNQSWDSFQTVLWPKVLGAWHLHRATAGCDLDMFVLFSSVTGVLGNPGQANHAAANAFLDQLAVHRRSQGLPGQAIAWGAWSEIGEAAEQRERMDYRSASEGLEWIAPQQGIEALDRLVREDTTGGTVIARDWAAFGESLESRPSLLDELLPIESDDSADESETEDLLSRLRDATVGMREDILASFLQGEVKAILRLPSTPAPSVGFFDLGMDSLMSVELRNRLNRSFADAYTVSNTAVFDYPNIAALSAFLAKELVQPVGDDGSSSSLPSPAPQLPVRREPDDFADGIAIVGMACRFPGAPDLNAFWRLLETGEDAVCDEGRGPGPWGESANLLPDGYAAFGRGGYVRGIDMFDSQFFGISPIEAEALEPQQRMLLETAWHALEDAGIDPYQLKGSRTGVYAGLASSEYRDLMTVEESGIGYLSTAVSSAVGRLSFHLGLTGPTVPVVLNCASSLVAVNHAVADLRARTANMAIAGGANAVLSGPVTTEIAMLGLLSRSGRCRAFDAEADGFVRAEGCGVVVLKRIADAEADGDRIWAVIRGSAVNHNGASAGTTIPNGKAQEQVIGDALSQARVSNADVDYLEAHGAGSSFGDSIEIEAAATAYGRENGENGPLLIGSVKSNIGHTESAAGVASLIKTALSMNRGVIPRNLHFRTPNPLIDWDKFAVRVVDEATVWPKKPDRPPRAGISAFGISGVNAHVVLEGYNGTCGGQNGHSPAGASQRIAALGHRQVEDPPSENNEQAVRNMRLLPLSGKSDAALTSLAKSYLDWLDERDEELSPEVAASDQLLSDMAWTAGIGRSHLAFRAGVAFRDVASLRAGLTSLAANPEIGKSPDQTKVAFVYPGTTDEVACLCETLHETEPVARAVLDRCERAYFDMRGHSLLDALFGRNGTDATVDDPDWGPSAAFAVGCSLTALWESVGIVPSIVVGFGAGEIAAAQGAGAFGLEDGLRLASNRLEPEAALDGVAVAHPSIGLVSGRTGRLLKPGELPDADYWRDRSPTDMPLKPCADALVESGVTTIIEVGSGSDQGARLADAVLEAIEDGGTWIKSLQLSAETGQAVDAPVEFNFVDAVAAAYEAGLPVSFEGLFVGEVRRRVALPAYPFQRRSHWVATRKRSTADG